jgi:AcrR family transcriptional regulator
VEAVLEAVPRVLQRYGARAVTTNRIAEVAGVSIGSLYQYFPDKLAIFSALHERHVEEVRQRIELALAERGSVRDFSRALMEGLSDLHAGAPELHEMVSAAVPTSSEGFQRALQATFGRVLETPKAAAGAHRMLFVLPRLVEALVHGIPQQRAPFAPSTAKGEAVRTVLLYLDSCETGRVS